MTSPFRIPDAPRRTRYKAILRGPRYRQQRYVVRIKKNNSHAPQS